MSDNRTKIIELLRSTNRSGMENVIAWLDTDPSFYVASGARIHHDNVIGGLAAHSLRVYNLAKADWESCDKAFKTKYPLESIIISALLHDVCKKDVYYIDADGNPTWNEENHRKGHGLRSVHLLEEQGLELTPDERMAIWWHMGEGNEMSQPNSRPMNVWPSGGIWEKETRCHNPTTLKSMPLPCRTLSASSFTTQITWQPSHRIKLRKRDASLV